MDEEQIVCNKIMTPDGTIIQSHHRHDYVTHLDKNGKEYMVDGGHAYLRRIVHDDAPYIELSRYMSDPYEDVRQSFTWGTRGKGGKEPLTWVPLCDLNTDHIIAIIETQNLTGYVLELMEKELEYRVECDA